MLHSLRQFSNHFIIKILMLMLIGSFLLWGINDVFRSNKVNLAFTAGKKSVTHQEYQMALRREQEYFRKRFGGQVTDEQLSAFGVERIVLERLIVEALLSQHTEAMGWDVGFSAAVAAIQQYPAFKDEQGKFNKQYFDMFLANQHMKERDYLNNLRHEIVINMVRDSLFTTPTFPMILAKPLFQRSIETRKFQKITVPGSYVSTLPEPSDTELVSFFNDHKKEFDAPEYRVFSWLTLDSKNLAQRFAVSDEEVKKYYEANKEQFSTSGSRDVDNLFFTKEEDAKRAYDRLKKGDDFAIVAKEEAKQAMDSYRFSHVTRPDLPGAISEPAFSLLEGQFSQPIHSDLGWHIVRAAKVYAQSYTPLEKVTAQIRQTLSSDRVTEGIYQITNQIEDTLAGGAKLEDVAKQFNLIVTTVGPVDRQGFNQGGSKIDSLPASAIFMKTAFESEKGIDSAVLESEDNTQRFIVRVDDITKARSRSLDEVHAKVVDAWKRSRHQTLLKETALNIQAQLAKGVEPTQLPNAAKLIITNESLNRADTHGTAVENTIFSLVKSGVSELLANPKDGYDIIKLLQVETTANPEADVRYTSFRNSVGKLAQNELYEQYINYLRKDYPVNVYLNLSNSDQ